MRVSHSRIKTWRRCAKAHDYKYNQRLRRKAPALPLLRGRIIGECLDAIAAGEGFESVLADYEKKYKRLFREEQEMYGDLIGETRSILSGYVRMWKNDGLKYVATEEKVEVELAPGLTFIGYIDKVVEDRHGAKWIMDHKSHKVLPDDDHRAADQQLVLYVWAYRKHSIRGVCWDYLRTKPPAVPEVLKSGELSRRANIDTDQYTYRKAVKDNGLNLEDYEEFISTLSDGSSFFERVWLPAPKDSLVETVVNDLRNDATVIKHLGETITSRNLSRDCPNCEYFQLCQAELRGHDSSLLRKSRFEEKDQSEMR